MLVVLLQLWIHVAKLPVQWAPLFHHNSGCRNTCSNQYNTSQILRKKEVWQSVCLILNSSCNPLLSSPIPSQGTSYPDGITKWTTSATLLTTYTYCCHNIQNHISPGRVCLGYRHVYRDARSAYVSITATQCIYHGWWLCSHTVQGIHWQQICARQHMGQFAYVHVVANCVCTLSSPHQLMFLHFHCLYYSTAI